MSSSKSGKRRPKRRYDTPGRMCAHSDGGCCPSCMNPFEVRRFNSRKIIALPLVRGTRQRRKSG